MTLGRTTLRSVSVMVILAAGAHGATLLISGTYTVAGLVVDYPALTNGVMLGLIASAVLLSAQEWPPTPDSLWKHDRILIFVSLLCVYLLNYRTIWAGDTLPLRYLPLALVRYGTLTLDRFSFLYTPGIFYEPLPADHVLQSLRTGNLSLPYYVQHVNGHYVSSYPVAASVLLAPLYVLPAIGFLPPYHPIFEVLEKVAAASLVAASAVVLYLAMLKRTTREAALGLTVIYGLCTSSMSTSSQALWQHGPSQLAVAVALLAILKADVHYRWLTVAGIALGAAVLFRPTNVVVVVAVLAYVALKYRYSALRVVPGLAAALSFQVTYNSIVFAHPFYSSFGSAPGFWSTPVFQGLSGILFSPGRGLFVYSPVVLFSFVALVQSWRKRGDVLLRCLSVGVLFTVLLYSKWFMWWGGHSYGPRMLADITPLLIFSLSASIRQLLGTPVLRSVFLVTCVWSAYAHFVGAFIDDGGGGIPDVDTFPERLWDWSTSPLVNGVFRAFNKLVTTVRFGT